MTGMGVMLNELFGDAKPSQDALNSATGREIKAATISENKDVLTIAFTDGSELALADYGQSCCESRYMTCDDDLPYYAGAKFLEVKLEDGPPLEDGWGEHEQQFLRIYTDRGVFVLANHNEHNGYYGGFSIGAHFNPPPAEAK